MIRDLAPPVLQDWEQNVPAVNFEALRTLAAKKNYPTQDEQVAAWEARKAAVAKVEETNEGTVETRKRVTRPGKDGVPCPVCERNTAKDIVAAFVVTSRKLPPRKPEPKKTAPKKGKGKK